MEVGVQRRVALALPAPPSLEGGASGRVSLALREGLRGHGVEVTAIAPRRPGHRVPPGVPDDVRLVDLADDRGRLRVNVERLRRPRGELARGLLLDEVRREARAAGLLHCEQLEAAWLGADADVPVVVHLYNLTRADRDLGAPWSRTFREVGEFALGERRVARAPHAFLASSPVVEAYVRRHNPSARIVRAPLSLVPGHYPRVPLDGPPVAGLIGTGTWAPTRDAVVRLVGRIWPRVREQVPDAVLRLAGWGMAELPELRAPGPGVEVVGEVGSATAFLAGLSVLLYPVTRGSGMKVKALEAVASGLPLVTTGCGAEGLPPTDGVVVDETDDGLVRAAVELLRDPLVRAQRGAAARACFEARLAPGPATAPVVALYDELRS